MRREERAVNIERVVGQSPCVVEHGNARTRGIQSAVDQKGTGVYSSRALIIGGTRERNDSAASLDQIIDRPRSTGGAGQISGKVDYSTWARRPRASRSLK